MARQEFIFNQLILIHFYRWIFCILKDRALSARSSLSPVQNKKLNACSCACVWVCACMCTNAVRKYWLNRIFEMFLLMHFHWVNAGEWVIWRRRAKRQMPSFLLCPNANFKPKPLQPFVRSFGWSLRWFYPAHTQVYVHGVLYTVGKG